MTQSCEQRIRMPILIHTVEFNSPAYKTMCALRYDVLRKPIGMELREKDVAQDHMEFHIGAFDEGKMIGCVLLRPLSETTVKLRQMAVADSYQGQGIGVKLVQFAEWLAVEEKFSSIEVNARKTAQGFYEKLGYAPTGASFIEVKQHTLKMAKQLKPDRV